MYSCQMTVSVEVRVQLSFSSTIYMDSLFHSLSQTAQEFSTFENFTLVFSLTEIHVGQGKISGISRQTQTHIHVYTYTEKEEESKLI